MAFRRFDFARCGRAQTKAEAEPILFKIAHSETGVAVTGQLPKAACNFTSARAYYQPITQPESRRSSSCR
jgi:hypothetical protein